LLQLFWQWSSQGAGKDVLFVTLGPAEADAVIRSIMQHMVASYSSMKVGHEGRARTPSTAVHTVAKKRILIYKKVGLCCTS
jgi:3-oxoacyl-(acyl-carrier-protein) synthase